MSGGGKRITAKKRSQGEMTFSDADNGNPAALRRLVAAGVKLQPFPTTVLEACFNATNEVCNEIVAKNPKFKKVWDIRKPYRSEQVLWSRIAEGGFDGFMARMYGAGKV